MTRDGTVNFREDVYKHDDTLDRDSLADVAAAGFVAPVKAAAPSPPREVKQIKSRQPLSANFLLEHDLFENRWSTFRIMLF